ncbi:MAG: acyl-CoA thioesterase [Nitrococcus sp.]|nr:acyl-CoA thioesterase [Nitrococcus sp.]
MCSDTTTACRPAPRRSLAERSLLTADIELQIPFQDVDAAQIVWHGNYFRYFEAARAALLRKVGYDYPEMRDSGFAWPLVDARARFVRPMRYAQWIRIEAGLVEWENRMKVEYRVTDTENGIRLGRGATVPRCSVPSPWTHGSFSWLARGLSWIV